MEINLTGNSAEGYTNPAQPMRKPLALGPTSQGELQRNVQRMNPFSPNNGNPGGANNMRGYNNAVSQGAKPMPGGYGGSQSKPQSAPQGGPPMPNFADYGGAQDFASAIRMYNQSTQRDRYDPAFGILPTDSSTAEDRALMPNYVDPYANQFTVDGRRRFDQMGYGAPPNYSSGSRPTPPMPSGQAQGYWDQGQRGDLGRYIPPMMQDYRNPQSWYNDGGYNYNLPGAAGQFPTQGGFAQNPPRLNTSRPPVPYPGG